MLTCCYLHIALSCSFPKPFFSRMMRLFIDLLFSFPFVPRPARTGEKDFLIISIIPTASRCRRHIIRSNLSDKALARRCKAIYHRSVITPEKAIERSTNLDSLNLINLRRPFHLQFPLISGCQLSTSCVMGTFSTHSLSPLASLFSAFLCALASCQKWNLISHNDNVIIIQRETMMMRINGESRGNVEGDLWRWWRLVMNFSWVFEVKYFSRLNEIIFEITEKTGKNLSKQLRVSETTYANTPSSILNLKRLSTKIKASKNYRKTVQINSAKIYVRCLSRNIC